MAITFLKSILTKIRNKLVNVRHGHARDQCVKAFKEDQEKEEALIIKTGASVRFWLNRSWEAWDDIMTLTMSSD